MAARQHLNFGRWRASNIFRIVPNYTYPYGSTTKCNRAVWSHTVVCGSMVASLLNSSTGCSNMRQKCSRRLWIHQAISGSMCSFWMLEPMEPQASLRLHTISYPFLGFERMEPRAVFWLHRVLGSMERIPMGLDIETQTRESVLFLM